MSAARTKASPSQLHDLVMPRLSDSMDEATVVEWLRKVGDEISDGDEIAMIETDKATIPLEATASGRLGEILVQAGETAALGATLARIGGLQERARAKASPVARRIAGRHGIDLLTLEGRGPNGRIVKADVEALIAGLTGEGEAANGAAEMAAAGGGQAAPAGRVATAPAAGRVDAPAPHGANGATTTQDLTRLQQTIARRMTESKSTIPDFVLRTEVDMEACVELRARLKDLAGADAPSFNDMVVKASALALREFPAANGSYADGSFVFHERAHVGVAVAGEGALVVPVIHDADLRSLGDIARATRAAAAKVRDGSITPRELAGGTFTVSNLGMYGVTSFTAVINPPQAAILAVGELRQLPVVEGGEIVARHRLDLSLTCDHRILYGADAARFLARIKELLGQPLRLAL